MQTITLGTSSLSAPAAWPTAAGRLNGAPVFRAAGKQAVVTAYETSYTIFDHADILLAAKRKKSSAKCCAMYRGCAGAS